MKRSFLSLSAALALVFSLISGGALASSDDEVKFTGPVESLPASGLVGVWRIDGRTVHVSSRTRVEQDDGRIGVGAIVKVEGSPRSDGSVDAEEIEVRQGVSGGGQGGGQGDDRGQGEVKFKGTVEAFPNAIGFLGAWRIGGRTVHVLSSTRIEQEDGPVAVGAFAEVEGRQQADGSINATKIEIKSNVGGGDGRHELNGIIESVPAGLLGDWVVSGRTVRVTSSTIIDRERGAIVVGALVEVKGNLRADGSIDATRIEVKTNADGNGQGGGFKGTIERLPNSADLRGDWIISGRVVHVISTTRLHNEHGPFVVGARVKVKGMRMSDGSVVATRVQVRD